MGKGKSYIFPLTSKFGVDQSKFVYCFWHLIMPSSEDSAGLCPSRVSINNGILWQNTIKFQRSKNWKYRWQENGNMNKVYYSCSLVLFQMCGMNFIQTGLIGLGLLQLRFIRFPLSKALMYKDYLIIHLSVFPSLSKHATFPQSISWEGFFVDGQKSCCLNCQLL